MASAVENWNFRNSPRSSSVAPDRRCDSTKATAPHAAAAASASTPFESQPHRWPLPSMVNQQNTVALIRPKPRMSNLPTGTRWSSGGRKSRPSMIANMQAGIGARKIARQLNASIVMPPSEGPRPSATVTPMLNMPMARPRRSGGKTWNSTSMTSGCRMPAAKPWATRPMISTSSVGAVKQTSPPAANSSMVSTNAARWPMRPITQELASSPVVFIARKVEERNCAWVWPTPNAPITFGMATFTMVPVKIEVKNAASAAVVASQRSAGVNRKAGGA